MREGLSKKVATRRIWLVDMPGLLTDNMNDWLNPRQAQYARPAAESRGWRRDMDAISLAEAVRRVHPTMLIGASTAAGSFTQEIVEEMAAHTGRPVMGHVSNAMLYPGFLGAIVCRALRISDRMLAAAANAVSSLVVVRLPGASLLPQVDNLRLVSMTVAVAFADFKGHHDAIILHAVVNDEP